MVREQSPKPAFYVFSDDVSWCKENINKLGFSDQDNVVFIEGNEPSPRNYIDMQLMTYCDYLIHDNLSSFCLAASIISEKEIKRITC